MRLLVRLALLVVALVGARQLWERQAELRAAGEDLNGQRRGIDATEADLDRLDRSIDDSEARLAALDAKITSIERQHQGGIPRDAYPGYSGLVAERNAVADEHNELVARQRDLRGRYQEGVDRHNASVAQVNSRAARGPLCTLLPASLRPAACRDDE